MGKDLRFGSRISLGDSATVDILLLGPVLAA